jgi:hypothetical protein
VKKLGENMPAAYNPKAKTVLIFTPTPNEYRAVKKHVSERNF